MSKIDYRQTIQHKSGLKFWISDVDAYVSDEAGTVIVDICREAEPENIYASVLFEVGWDNKSIDFFWEPDGEATFVDYGSQSVMYDSGEGGPDHIELDNFEVGCEDWTYIDYDDYNYETKLTREQVLDKLGCSDSDLSEIVNEVQPLIFEAIKAEVERYYEDHSNWPDKPKYESDYDDWYLDRDDWN